MIFLSGTTETLNVQTVGAGTIHYSVYYTDQGPSSTSFAANSNQGTVATAQTTVILAAPASGFNRQVKGFSVVNRALSAQTIIVHKVVGGTVSYLSANTILGPGQSLWYSDEQGFQVRDAHDMAMSRTTIVGPSGDTEYTKNFNTHGGARIMVTNTNYLIYLGRAPRDGMKTVALRYRVTIAGAGATIAEAGIYIGEPKGMPTGTSGATTIALQCVGWADWLANYATIGNYTTTVTLGGSTPIKEGDAVWGSLFSTFATTGATVKACAGSDIVTSNECTVTADPARQPSLELNFITVVNNQVQVGWPWYGYSFGWN